MGGKSLLGGLTSKQFTTVKSFQLQVLESHLTQRFDGFLISTQSGKRHGGELIQFIPSIKYIAVYGTRTRA